MPSLRVKKEFKSGTYFITLTVKNFYYLFDRYNRWEILSDSLIYYIRNKNIQLHSYVFMLNHIHLLVSSEDILGFIKNYKSYNSKKLLENIKMTEPNVLKLFAADNCGYRFWTKNNHPEDIYSEKFYLQKLFYIENNPVKKNYVELPEHWYWSSANENNPLSTLIVNNL